jgi:hypothetical protein
MTDADKAEYEGVIRLLTAKVEELAGENARLRSSENNAHSVLREVYNDPTASPAVRVKATGLALGHESAPLKAQPAPLELTAAKPANLPLAELVRLQRARADALQGLPPGHPEYEKWVWREDYTCPALDSPSQGSNDSSSDDSNDR